MVLNKYLLAGLFAINAACLAGGVMATVPDTVPTGPVVTETANDARQDRKNESEQARQDQLGRTENEKQDVQVAKNSQDIQNLNTLTGTQTFTLQLIGIFMPLLSLLATGMIAYFQYKARAERHAMAEESRSNLGQMGRSINGMKSELVAAVKAAAFAEGAAHALSPHTDPENVEQLRARAKELAEEAEAASRRAAILADEAVRKIEAKPENSP